MAEDKDLFRKAMQGVKPLAPKIRAEKPVAVKSAPAAMKPAQIPSHAAHKNLPELKHGDSAGIDDSTYAKFKSGDMPIEARLDLHGMTSDAAQRAVSDFIARCFVSRMRCVLIITGKGKGSKGGDDLFGKSILRDALPQWLNTAVLRAKILAFTHAAPRHGGSGAFYVLLKRQR